MPENTPSPAAHATASVPPVTLTGWLDHVDHSSIRGWAFNPATPDQGLWLEVVVDDEPPIAFLSNMFRQDLLDSGFGDGRLAFHLMFPQPLDPRAEHSVALRWRDDGQLISNAPWTLPRAPSAGAAARAAFEAALSSEVEAVAAGPDLDATLGFLLRQADRLLQTRADIQSGAQALQRFRLRWSDYLPGARAQPPQPDGRPWALIVDAELPDTEQAFTMINALHALGHRVAVVATRELPTTGAMVGQLTTIDVTVLGAPEHFTVEDVLRRNRALFRVVVLRGAVTAAGYGVLTRIHQPRARVIACLGDPPNDRSDPMLNLNATLIADVVLIHTEQAAQQLHQQLPGRELYVVPPEAEASAVTQVMTKAIIPPNRRPPANPGAPPAPA